jgi:hypothetical protein
MQVQVINKRGPGRPRGKNKAQGRAAQAFFREVDRLGLTFRDVRKAMMSAGYGCPSYRTLQDWRRGIFKTRFAPFVLWTAAIQEFAAKNGDV